MVKALAVTTLEACEIEDWDITEFDYLHLEGYSIEAPIAWLKRKHTLNMFVLEQFDERDGVNKEGT